MRIKIKWNKVSSEKTLLKKGEPSSKKNITKQPIVNKYCEGKMKEKPKKG